jgi:NADH dehydrogenase
LPGSGKTLLQPLWIEDLAVSLTWNLNNHDTLNKTIDIGGPEYLSISSIIDLIINTLGIRRNIVRIPPPYMRGMTILLESIFRSFPVSLYWLDYLAANRTCALDSIPRTFNVLPTRMSKSIGYLE